MSAFFWASGHLGWGFFAVLVFSGVWLLVVDYAWRLKNVAIRKLLAVMGGCWLLGVALIVLAYR